MSGKDLLMIVLEHAVPVEKELSKIAGQPLSYL
jgi:hypothetical protein